MYAQQQQMIPPQIARIVEETVNNIRELDGRLDVLRTDLALLCQTIGLPEAAHKVLSSRVGVGLGPQSFAPQSPFTQGFGQTGGVPGYGTSFSQNPLQGTPFGVGQSPLQGTPFGVGQSPFGNPWAGTPWTNPSPQQNPYGFR